MFRGNYEDFPVGAICTFLAGVLDIRSHNLDPLRSACCSWVAVAKTHHSRQILSLSPDYF